MFFKINNFQGKFSSERKNDFKSGFQNTVLSIIIFFMVDFKYSTVLYGKSYCILNPTDKKEIMVKQQCNDVKKFFRYRTVTRVFRYGKLDQKRYIVPFSAHVKVPHRAVRSEESTFTNDENVPYLRRVARIKITFQFMYVSAVIHRCFV